MADEVAHLVGLPLAHGASLRDAADIIHQLSLLGDALSASEDEDMQEILERVSLFRGEQLQERDGLPEDSQELSLFRLFLLFLLLFATHLLLFLLTESRTNHTLHTYPPSPYIYHRIRI